MELSSFVKILCGALFLFWVSACQPAADSESFHTQDPHSYAHPEDAVVKHLALDLSVNFEDQTLSGWARLTVENPGNVSRIYLDTKDLKIQEVALSTDGEHNYPTQYTLAPADSILGAQMAIDLDGKATFVHIRYETSPYAEALQWLEPQLTAGKKFPFLLTQSQAINARTWVPIQDSPGIRFTYSATIKVPEYLMAVMSAENPQTKNADGIYRFTMSQPIPAYLLALAVGDLEFRAVGTRTGIYADPVVLDAAAYEFAEMDEMLSLAEKLYGPYQWGRYDVVVLPPSFPFGGMENPRLTFATPTVLAGDRSLVSLIAHELAHSWSGNLVTNATWNDFWLNEGFTVYFEYRIMEALKGREYSEMLAQLSYQDLLAEMGEMGKGNPDSRLKPDLKGRNPDDGMNSIAYDKGYYFLRLLEEKLGREKFDAFLNAYFKENAFKTMTTEEFVSRLYAAFPTKEQVLNEEVRVEEWVSQPGLPDNCPQAQSLRFQQVEDALASWSAGASPKRLNTDGWSTHQWLHFMRTLPEGLTMEQMTSLDDAFHFTASGNAEIQCLWYTLAIRHNYEPAFSALETFLVKVGRRKFLTPLYREMKKTEKGEKMAFDIYEKARPNYHPLSYKSIDELLEWKPGVDPT